MNFPLYQDVTLNAIGRVRAEADGRKIRKACRVEKGIVKINSIGIIVNSEHLAHQIRVEHDAEKTGGYFIFEWWDGSDGTVAIICKTETGQKQTVEFL